MLSLVLAPALVLSWLADKIGMAMKASAACYEQPLMYYFAFPPASLETLRTRYIRLS